MTENQIKQAYVTGLAARGLLRQMYKQAAEAEADGAKGWGFSGAGGPDPVGDDPNFGMDMAKSYIKYTGTGAGLGAIIGTLIQLARQKSLVTGALVGAGIGGGIGAGHRGLRHIKGYRDSDLNVLDPLIFDPIAQAKANMYADK